MNLKNARILITGAHGFVGCNLVKALMQRGIVPATPQRDEYDLTQPQEAESILGAFAPDLVINLAGLVGGIGANKERPADFFYHNLMIGTNMLHACYKYRVRKYITLIGGCSYPADARNPIIEAELLNGYPQVESAPYSLAKAMSLVQAQAYRKQYGLNAVVLCPGNMYGAYDNFDEGSSHVIPAMIRKFVQAAQERADSITLWGTGEPVRDFVYVEDVCEAILIAAERHDSSDLVNISSGLPTSISLLASMIANRIGFTGRIIWDHDKPNGQMNKLFDVTRMKTLLGYECKTTLAEGLTKTINWYLEHQSK